ncbi:hypothetical protein J6590_066927 [Homalodisca vitripennis]|nr:hypothetical protein J6590_066927 [Homalodisca vitripennis]
MFNFRVHRTLHQNYSVGNVTEIVADIPLQGISMRDGSYTNHAHRNYPVTQETAQRSF